MSFVFQQPGSASVLDSINAAAERAEHGGGMFAFATRLGIDRFLGAPNVRHMLESQHHFTLVVGVDAITNGDALLRLEEAVARYGQHLRVRAFLHEYSGTFHPKFAWFRRGNELAVVTGSGNLTNSGLGVDTAASVGNWEAAFTHQIPEPNATETERTIGQWIDTNIASGHLRIITDPDVRDQAMANSRVRISPPNTARRRVARAAATATPQVMATAAPIAAENDVLIRELPQNRPGQADIGRAGLRFLGFEDRATTVFMQYVDLANNVGPTNEQRLFVNASQNYRVEVPQINLLGYDIDGNDNRMLLVAVRLNSRSFRYTLVPVTHTEYRAVSVMLPQLTRQGAGRRMRIVETTSAQLALRWPSAPSNLLPVIGFAMEA